MSQEKKSAFEVANTSNKSVIVIVGESDEDGEGFSQMVSIAGQGGVLVESLARFVTDSEAKEVVHEALKLASLKAIIDKFGDKFDEESDHVNTNFNLYSYERAKTKYHNKCGNPKWWKHPGNIQLL